MIERHGERAQVRQHRPITVLPEMCSTRLQRYTQANAKKIRARHFQHAKQMCWECVVYRSGSTARRALAFSYSTLSFRPQMIHFTTQQPFGRVENAPTPTVLHLRRYGIMETLVVKKQQLRNCFT